MSKMGRKHRRIFKLCTNKRYMFDRYLNKESREEITEWCDENLTGSYVWFGSSIFDEEKSEIGFQDETDLIAFILRWT